jgi:hypothetical protein
VARAGAQPQPNTGQLVPGLLPTRGINARDAFLQMGPEDAINLVNFLSDDAGLVLRGGYQEFATGLPGGVNVSTLMSYYPATAGPSTARGFAPASAMQSFHLRKPRAEVSIQGQLFACTNGGIFDVTAGGPGPWTNICPVAAPSDFWSWLNFQSAAGNFLLTANDLGGYFVYNGTGSFTQVAAGTSPGQIATLNPNLIVFVMTWKRRVWFIEKDSTRAHYLPVEQITGTTTVFDFGSHFRHGGRLASLFNWTLDGGEGIDDYLVALSDQGDVVIFKGYDPDSAASDPNAFQLHGIWYVGAVPVGRRQVTLYGGDAYILSVFGITQLSKLVSNAQDAADLIEDVSSRIDPYISQLMEGDTSANGWYITFLPTEQMMVLGVPQQLTGEGLLQLAMKIRRGAWSKLLDLPMATMLNHDSLAFGGGAQTTTVNGGGRVYLLFANALDNVPLTLPQGNPIRGRIVPAFNPFQTPGQWKVFPMVRPIIRTQATPSVRLTVLTDFTDSTLFSAPTIPNFQTSLWDVDLWDVGLWSGFRAPIRKWFGTTGAGFSATVQLDVVGLGGLSIMSIDWWLVSGGAL